MDPATLASLAVGALARYAAAKVIGLTGRAGREIDEVVDEKLHHLYDIVRAQLGTRPRAEQSLHDFNEDPSDERRRGRLEFALEGIAAGNPTFAQQLTAILAELEEAPSGGVLIQDAGAVALRGNVTIQGHNASGRDLHVGRDDQR